MSKRQKKEKEQERAGKHIEEEALKHYYVDE